MSKEIEINGCIEIPTELSMDEFWEILIDFVESNHWSFGGCMKEIVDGYYINPDGSRGPHI